MKNPNEKVPSLIPVLAVDDIKEAVEFYKQLGFNEIFSIPDQKGQLVHAHLKKGDSVLFLGRLDVSYHELSERATIIKNSHLNDRGLGITLILQVENLEETYDLIHKMKLNILVKPTDEYYGDRVFFFIDPFGYEWKISQPL